MKVLEYPGFGCPRSVVGVRFPDRKTCVCTELTCAASGALLNEPLQEKS